jgi:hypothetical protein
MSDARQHPDPTPDEARDSDLPAIPPSVITRLVFPRDSDLSAVPPSVITRLVFPRDSDLSAVPPSVITL